MIDKNCFNASPTGKSCLVLTVRGCPENCSAKITDPQKYIERLEEMLNYNAKNGHSCATLRARIAGIRKKYNIPDPEDVGIKRELGAYAGLAEAYWQDTHRGEKGSHSEGNVNNAAIKAKMKDNRPQECKLNSDAKQEIYEATKKFEEEHGKLDKLSRSLMTRSKIDSYTGEEIVEPKKKKK
jgi:hypothetical protein